MALDIAELKSQDWQGLAKSLLCILHKSPFRERSKEQPNFPSATNRSGFSSFNLYISESSELLIQWNQPGNMAHEPLELMLQKERR